MRKETFRASLRGAWHVTGELAQERTAVHDAAGVQVLQARRDLRRDVQHLAQVRGVVLRPLAGAQQPAVHRRLRTQGRA